MQLSQGDFRHVRYRLADYNPEGKQTAETKDRRTAKPSIVQSVEGRLRPWAMAVRSSVTWEG